MLMTDPKVSNVRRNLYAIIPPMCIVLSGTAAVLSHTRFPSSQFLLNVSTSSIYGIIWSIILLVIVLVYFRRDGTLIRTSACVAGFVGFLILESAYEVPMFYDASQTSGVPISEKYFIAMSLVTIVWVLGLWWFVEALSISKHAGDWNNTVWIRQRN